MASFGGVAVSDPKLSGHFTQGQLRALKAQFDAWNVGKSGVITAAELEAGMENLNLSKPLTTEEVAKLVEEHDVDHKGGLEFESFLRVQLELQKNGRSPSVSPQKSAFLTNAQFANVHHISASEKRAYVDHINTYLDNDPAMVKYLPIDPTTDDLFNIAKDGVLLCKLINLAVTGTIDERAMNIKDKLNPWERNENHTLCLNSAKAIGCSVVNIGTQDLVEGRPHLVLGLITQIVKVQLLADINLKKTPELAELLDDMEEFEELLRLPAEKLLLRWMNYHLKKAGYTKVISNYSSDVKDGTAYAVLLHKLAPESCTLEPLNIADPLERAQAVLAQASRIGSSKYLSAKDIVDGSPNLNLAFVAHLFRTSGLSTDSSKFTFAELIESDDEQDSREERAFRMWINSLGIEYVSSLFEDVRDGWVLLEVLDKVSPGSVNWKGATKPPIKMPFKKVENCNQAISIGKSLKFSLVNVSGKDLVEGNKKLTLAFLWQLMRYHMFYLLKNLRLKGKEVSEADIVQWANIKVRNVGKTSKMESFKDKSLASGVFFLDLLGAVEPRVVNWNIVTSGLTEEDRKKNAMYIISVARKIGCSIFLLWDDIVEVRPKMILTLAASIMLWSLSSKAKVADASASPEKSPSVKSESAPSSPPTAPASPPPGEDVLPPLDTPSSPPLDAPSSPPVDDPSSPPSAPPPEIAENGHDTPS
ncbi:hypothetical protein Mapa_011584 [Marchantia paleacea]|nr:hypothetical protein Mapa_011584 [Marchantia paleacea]